MENGKLPFLFFSCPGMAKMKSVFGVSRELKCSVILLRLLFTAYEIFALDSNCLCSDEG